MCDAEEDLRRLQGRLDRSLGTAERVIETVLEAAADVERGIIDIAELRQIAERERRTVWALS